MIAAICWKEYRQQRGLWYAAGSVAVLLAFSIAASLGRADGVLAFHDQQVRDVLRWLGFALILTEGVVCGALLLAGEKEDGTLPFLDTLPADRLAVWQAKALAGVLLCIAQALFLVAVGLMLGLLDFELALSVPLIGVDALICGLVAGALCRNVLIAVLAGSALLMANWLIALIYPAVTLIAFKLAFAAGGVVWSRRLFGASDRARLRDAPLGVDVCLGMRRPSTWSVLSWLMWQQGRWVLVAGTVAAIILGLAVNLGPMIFYPAGTLIVGLVCGLATFAPDQGRQQGLFGAQRFPPGRVWAFKIGFWALAAAALAFILWAVSVTALIFMDTQSQKYTGQSDYWKDVWFGGSLMIDRGLFLTLWLAQGFCVGQFCAFWATRPFIAAIVASVLAAALTLLWWASVLFGGLAFWQVFGVPTILLAGTRLYFWRWLTGRLQAPGSLVGLAALSLVAVAWTAMGLSYRVAEIPVAKLDIEQFLAEIPPPEKNEAGQLIHKTGQDFISELTRLDEEFVRLGVSELWLFRPGPLPARRPTPEQPVPQPAVHPAILGVLDEILKRGWPKDDRELSHWLDRICAEPWFQELQRASRMPVGVVHDPRNVELLNAHWDEFHCQDMVTVLKARALQLIARGMTQQAIEPMATMLGLSRQLRNHSFHQSLHLGNRSESNALEALTALLEMSRPHAKELHETLTLLQHHEIQRPFERQALIAKYLVAKNTVERDPGATFDRQGHRTSRLVWRCAWQVPWEHARQERLGILIYSAWWQQMGVSYWEYERRRRLLAARPCGDVWTGIGLEQGFPPPEGPGADWSPARWGHLSAGSWPFALDRFHRYLPDLETRLRADMLMIALLLYQHEKGKLPDKLDELVPAYLPSLPLDPFSGKSFHYRVSSGERLELSLISGQKKGFVLQAGQALVWSEGNHTPKERGERLEDWLMFPVPVRKGVQ